MCPKALRKAVRRDRGRDSYCTPPNGRQVHRTELHARRRGGADDPRRRDVRARQRDRGRGRRLRGRRRGQARAAAERARDRHAAVQGPRARPATTCAGCAARSPRPPPREGSRSAPPARTRSRSGRSSASRADPRYRDLIAALRFIARQEIIFGLHVHVGIDDPEKAIHVANGMRVHVPILLALSANSPYWRADETGLASTRMPIFRAFPRVGIPPHYEDWADYQERIGVHGRRRRDGRPHLPLVRRPPAPEVRHGRGPRDGRADPRRAHARP